MSCLEVNQNFNILVHFCYSVEWMTVKETKLTSKKVTCGHYTANATAQILCNSSLPCTMTSR